MEASGYAASLADFSGEQVYIAELYYRDPDPPARWDNGILNVRDESGGEALKHEGNHFKCDSSFLGDQF